MFPSTPAERLIILHEDEPGDTKIGRCAAGGPLRLGDKVYPHGIGVNSQSTLRVELDRPASHFLAVIGLDRNVDNTKASCRFHVHVGNREVWATEILRTIQRTAHNQCASRGCEGVRLDRGRCRRRPRLGPGRLGRCQGAVGGRTGALAGQSARGCRSSILFRLWRGKHSSEFLGHWTREVKTEKISDTTTRRTLTLTEPTTRLEARAVCLVYQDTAGLSHPDHSFYEQG